MVGGEGGRGIRGREGWPMGGRDLIMSSEGQLGPEGLSWGKSLELSYKLHNIIDFNQPSFAMAFLQKKPLSLNSLTDWLILLMLCVVCHMTSVTCLESLVSMYLGPSSCFKIFFFPTSHIFQWEMRNICGVILVWYFVFYFIFWKAQNFKYFKTIEMCTINIIKLITWLIVSCLDF